MAHKYKFNLFIFAFCLFAFMPKLHAEYQASEYTMESVPDYAKASSRQFNATDLEARQFEQEMEVKKRAELAERFQALSKSLNKMPEPPKLTHFKTLPQVPKVKNKKISIP